MKIRPSSVAGRFYSGDAATLRQDVEKLLAAAPDLSADNTIVAGAVPHAGYVFSASIAAPVFKSIAHADFDTIVIIGHDFGHYAPGIIAVLPTCDAFRTPLGDVPVDTELCNALANSDKRIIFNDRVHNQEHTVEVQLPFLQVCHPPCKIVPVLFGEVTAEHCETFARLLNTLKGNRKLFVLSSTDLSHYPPYDVSRELDRQTVAFAEKFDLEGLCTWKDKGLWEGKPGVETPICSAGGLGTAMVWAQLQGADKAIVARRGNSGDVPVGGKDKVVGYSSLLFAKAKPASQPEFSLSQESQSYLLALARKTLETAVQGQRLNPATPPSQELQAPAAVFVTLHKQGRLRGCIGCIAPQQPLYKAVRDYAIAAGFEDPRFTPVTKDELQDIHIEISVLSPLKTIASHEEIIPGKHGVTVTRGNRRGLFLPQVWEQLPTKELFMRYLCEEKAGLPGDAWLTNNVQLSVFTVFPFEE